MCSRWAAERALRGALCAALAAGACARDDAEQLLPPAGMTQQGVPVRTSDLRAGAVAMDVSAENPYAADGQALAEGRRLYTEMNCVGCHGGAGGGGMGPPLADADWIYGSDPENIVQSVLQGRPNGMPSFGGKLPPDAAWRLAAFVRSLDKEADAQRQRASSVGETISGDGAAVTRQPGASR